SGSRGDRMNSSSEFFLCMQESKGFHDAAKTTNGRKTVNERPPIENTAIDLLESCGINWSSERPIIGKVHNMLKTKLIGCATCGRQLNTCVVPSSHFFCPSTHRNMQISKSLTVFFTCKSCSFLSAKGFRIRLYDLDFRSISIINLMLFPDAGLSIPKPQKCTKTSGGVTFCGCSGHRVSLH
ncbi:hypothetical protein PFISCL1PPCAC_10056, partial [Pristionchus fissidentatus]